MAARDWSGAVRQRVGPWLRVGPRTVVMTSDAIRLGNLLYVWMSCHRRQSLGRDVRALTNAHTTDWEALWDLRGHGLVLDRLEVRPWDRRADLPARHLQVWGQDFSPDDLDAFCHDVLLTEPFASLIGPDDDGLTVNVRRGDYYDNSEYRARYGFDVPAYLEEAVAVSVAQDGRPSRIVVVSDDQTWCRDHLSWLSSASDEVSFSEGGPAKDLAVLASARRLILANSTFSYWGGYLSQVVRGGDPASVVAPRFHVRDVNDGVAWQLNPAWTILDGFA